MKRNWEEQNNERELEDVWRCEICSPDLIVEILNNQVKMQNLNSNNSNQVYPSHIYSKRDFGRNKSSPEPVLTPHLGYIFNGDAFCLGDEEGDEESHGQHEEGEDEEEAKLGDAEQAEEDLANYKGHQHVDGGIDALPG
ncbi:hypothetical protein Sjap_003703 [Stephania japonica]|uniref:Uncharacterized protein n=1 Tax=Stephania japonica TaxID=461633 RepID=A0AAP0KPD1_9MAGN